MLVLVIYDIPDNKRRTLLSNFLEGYGQRVQYSVFECFLSLAQMKELFEKVKKKSIHKKIMLDSIGYLKVPYQEL